jgi:hypothetical protein
MKQYSEGEIEVVYIPSFGLTVVRFFFADRGGFEIPVSEARKLAQRILDLTEPKPLPVASHGPVTEQHKKRTRKDKATA